MLSLNPPYQVLDGYTVFSDHADPTLYYVLPSAPNLVIDAGRPALSLLEFQASAPKVEGGLLTLTTELRVPDDALASLRGRVARIANRSPGELRLTPILFDAGSVELVALGASSGPPPSPPAAGDASASSGSTSGPTDGTGTTVGTGATTNRGPFSITFLGSATPSLGGANTATFQLVLDPLAAQLVAAAVDAPDLPIIAIYRMTFAGLRPSYGIKIDADWSKVYRSLQQKAKANVYYVSADVDTMVSSALEENGIRVDTTVFGTSDGAQAAAERARKQLLDWALEHMFQPMADPTNATANSIGQAIDDTVWSLARTILPGVSYRLRALNEQQLRLFSARMDESVAERREVVPQGTLGGVLNRYRVDAQGKPRAGWPALKSQMVQQVALNGFPRLDVKVGSEDRFQSDGLSEVQVEIGRPLPDGTLADSRSFAFRNAADRQSYTVNLLGEVPPDFTTLYRYRQDVSFNPTSPFGPHPIVSTSWQTGRTSELYVEPRDAYAVREVQALVSPDFSFAQFPAITVELRYSGESANPPPSGRIQLTADQPTQSWRFRAFSPTPLPYEARVTYHRPADAGGDIQGGWTEHIDDYLDLPSPLPTHRYLNLFVNLPWTDISVAFLDLRYRDDKNGVHFDDHLDLDANTRFIRKDYLIAQDGPTTLSYRLTVLPKLGDVVEGSWRDTEDDRLSIDRRLVDRRQVSVRLVGGTLLDNKLSDVRITLEVHDPQSDHVRDSTKLAFSADQPDALAATWEYVMGDPPIRSVYYSALFVDQDGFTSNVAPTKTDADLLVVQLRTRAISA